MKEYSGELFQVARFNAAARCFARVHNNFLYVFNTPSAENPSAVYFLEKATVREWVMKDGLSVGATATRRIHGISAL